MTLCGIVKILIRSSGESFAHFCSITRLIGSETKHHKTLYPSSSDSFGGFDTKDEAEQFGKVMRERLSYVTEYTVREIQE